MPDKHADPRCFTESIIDPVVQVDEQLDTTP
jgi:hypothetical protein